MFRKQRKNKLSISLYENDDPNDFSDYGIGGSRSTNDLRMTQDDISNMVNIKLTRIIGKVNIIHFLYRKMQTLQTYNSNNILTSYKIDKKYQQKQT